MHLMLQETDPKDRQKLTDQLTGRFRTMGKPLSPDEVNAPAWWHGDEEAFESVMASMPAMRR